MGMRKGSFPVKIDKHGCCFSINFYVSFLIPIYPLLKCCYKNDKYFNSCVKFYKEIVKNFQAEDGWRAIAVESASKIFKVLSFID